VLGERFTAKQKANETAWFMVRVAVLSLVINYIFGGPVTLFFVAGWWWGAKSGPLDDKEVY
jgi:hypothetical protein